MPSLVVLSESSIFEPLLLQKLFKLLPYLVFDVDILMAFVSLDDHPRHVPSLNNRRLRHILIMQVEALHSMENVDDLRLLLHVGNLSLTAFGWTTHSGICIHLVILWRPVLELERLAIREKTDDARPVLLGEAVDRIVYFKFDIDSIEVTADAFVKHLFGVVLFVRCLCDIFGRLVAAVPQKLHRVFQADIAWVLRGRDHDNGTLRWALVVLRV